MAETAWLDDEEQDAWRSLVAVPRRLLARLDDDLQRRGGPSLPEYEVLVYLSEAPDVSVRMAELAERLVLSPSGLTRRLDGLVRDGLVERRACPSDRRGSLAVLTAKGRQRLEAAAPDHVASVRSYVVDRLSGSELQGLAAALQRIAAALDCGGGADRSAAGSGPTGGTCPSPRVDPA